MPRTANMGAMIRQLNTTLTQANKLATRINTTYKTSFGRGATLSVAARGIKRTTKVRKRRRHWGGETGANTS